jgi:protein required for attachment to host cells
MSKTWFVVLSQSSMKLFTQDTESKNLSHIQTVVNPEAKLKTADIVRHRPGPGATPPHDLVVRNFALKMARYLDSQRRHKKLAELRIAAEPKFLGVLKKALPTETLKIVKDWILKDLEKADTRQLARAFVKSYPVPLEEARLPKRRF